MRPACELLGELNFLTLELLESLGIKLILAIILLTRPVKITPAGDLKETRIRISISMVTVDDISNGQNMVPVGP